MLESLRGRLPSRLLVQGFVVPDRTALGDTGEANLSGGLKPAVRELNRRLADGKKLPWPPFGKQWYAGCTTLIVDNSAKAGIRTSALTSHWAPRTTREEELTKLTELDRIRCV